MSPRVLIPCARLHTASTARHLRRVCPLKHILPYDGKYSTDLVYARLLTITTNYFLQLAYVCMYASTMKCTFHDSH